MKKFNRALKANPKNAIAWNNRGIIFWKKGKYL